MTIAKLIICGVDDNKKDDFSTSQCSWHQLSNCEGFCGQAGGWDISSSTATILGFWASQAHVDEFMKTTHDEIFEHNKQQGTYNNCAVNYYKLMSTTLGVNVDIFHGGLLSITHCSGVSSMDPFTQEQQIMCNPQLSQQLGILSARIWRHITLEDNYMLVTHWVSKKHDLRAIS
ncbi:YdbC family protein [Paucibacter sp. O1-1]|nr:YdbC family protein [Paucibacter sp. O1-1]MDA3831426.1 YdbC family protein [Paucibacter sp. O1-1]